MGSRGFSRGVLPITGTVLVLTLGVALAARSTLAVAAVAVVAALVVVVVVWGVGRVEARLDAYEEFRRSARGLVFACLITVALWLVVVTGSRASWTLVLPVLWTAVLAINVWRLVRHRPRA